MELQLELGDERPIFLAIARALAAEIRRGRLRPGAALPGARTLAETLGVHRNTVVAAYEELGAEGWLHLAARRRPTVVPELPDPKIASSARRRAPLGFSVPTPPPAPNEVPPRGAVNLAGGMPDVSLVPIAALSRALRRALRRRELLDYGDPRGEPRLRAAIAEMLRLRRGLDVDPARILVTRGSQMGLDLVSRALFTSRSRVAVEAFGYAPAWAALGAAAKLTPVPVDRDGLVVERLARSKRLDGVYVTPHHQFPTTVVMSAARRLSLLAFARARRVPIIEDDYDNEMHYFGRPVLPLAARDEAGVVIYVGTLSKVLAPGLRLGFVVAPEPLIDRLAILRRHVDRQGDRVLETAVAELFEDGEIERHTRRMRRVYRARREVMLAALAKRFGASLEVTPSPGGLALWCRTEFDAEAWCARARVAGVWLWTAKSFVFDQRPRDFARIGFARNDEATLESAVQTLARCRPR